jgi:HSP20 family protein
MGTCWGDYEVWSRRVESLLKRLGRSATESGFEGGTLWSPPTDVFETEDGVVVKMELPGVAAEDLSIVLVDDRLVVRGERRDPDAGRRTRYHQMEIAYGRFAKIVFLRIHHDREGIRAALGDGYLNLTIPRASEPAPEKVAVEITCD